MRWVVPPRRRSRCNISAGPASLSFQPVWSSTWARPSWYKLSMTPWVILMDICKKRLKWKRIFLTFVGLESWILPVPWGWMSSPSQWCGPAVLCRDGGPDSWERLEAPAHGWPSPPLLSSINLLAEINCNCFWTDKDQYLKKNKIVHCQLFAQLRVFYLLNPISSSQGVGGMCLEWHIE